MKNEEKRIQFHIEQLTKNRQNKQIIKRFYNERNSSLQDFLRKRAWDSDFKHETVTYLIKMEKMIVCYFTLKSGMLLMNSDKQVKHALKANELYVYNTIPAIELAHFCMNEKWVKQNEKGQGKLIFYSYILPIVKKLSEYAGCRFMYLYAADDTEDETLVKYYESLKFKKIHNGYYSIFPAYDIGCTLMYTSLDGYATIDFTYIKELGMFTES